MFQGQFQGMFHGKIQGNPRCCQVDGLNQTDQCKEEVLYMLTSIDVLYMLTSND